MYAEEIELKKFWSRMFVWFVVGGLVLIFAAMAGCPYYNVYANRMQGQAELAKSQASRQALVSQAQAEKDSALLRAEAIGIVGEAAKKYPEYRQQEFIGAFANALEGGKINQIIYVPTEANIPIIERKEK